MPDDVTQKAKAAAPGPTASSPIAPTPAAGTAADPAPTPRFPVVPASFFGMVLGLIGLGGAWRAAHGVWGVPALVGESVMVAGVAVWAVVMALFALKWLFARPLALAEARHPVQCCFIGLAGVSTLLVALAAGPYSHTLAVALLAAGAAFTFGFAVWATGQLWRGERELAAATPVLYLPTVAGPYVTAIVCGALGFADWGQLAFGVGLFSWLAMESVLLNRFQHGAALAPALRPTLGIQIAPSVVGAAAYLSVTQGPPDVFARALVGYGLFQVVLMLRLLPWILRQPLSAAYWAFTFGLTALSSATLRLVERGETGAVAALAPVIFVGTLLVVGFMALHTLHLLAVGRLLTPPPGRPAA